MPMQDDKVILNDLISRAKKKGFDDYWERFGYMIGGPICYAYTRWVIDELDKRSDLSGIAFVARDGWLLRKAYELLPHKRNDLKYYYIYAPRILWQLFQEDISTKQSYTEYISSFDFGDAAIAVIDTATVNFSSQRLIQSSTKNKTFGFFWTAAKGADVSRDLQFMAFQSGCKKVLRSWDIVEMVLTSPEPPIAALKDGTPVFKEAEGIESDREARFVGIEKGVLRFLNDIVAFGEMPKWDCSFITDWVNGFLSCPSTEDVEAFRNVRLSEAIDHSDNILMNPFSERYASYRGLKEYFWLYSAEHPALYRLLHKLNRVRQAVTRRIKKSTSNKKGE